MLETNLKEILMAVKEQEDMEARGSRIAQVIHASQWRSLNYWAVLTCGVRHVQRLRTRSTKCRIAVVQESVRSEYGKLRWFPAVFRHIGCTRSSKRCVQTCVVWRCTGMLYI